MSGSKTQMENLSDVEIRLADAFRPIKPSNKFVKNVRKRIRFTPPVLIANKPPETQHLLLVLGGVLSVSLMIITVARAIYFFVGRRKVA